MAGAMNLHQVIDFCAQHGIDGVDLTGYYFPGYPRAPSDEFLYSLKREAFENGVTISGTGVRNDFALPDASSRRGHVLLVKDWVDVAAKLGADVVRVFSGRERPKGYTFDQALEWMSRIFRNAQPTARSTASLSDCSITMTSSRLPRKPFAWSKL